MKNDINYLQEEYSKLEKKITETKEILKITPNGRIAIRLGFLLKEFDNIKNKLTDCGIDPEKEAKDKKIMQQAWQNIHKVS